MAEIDDLKKEIDDLQKKLAGLNPYTESPVRVVTGTKIVRRSRQNITEPIYGTINQASPNQEYNKTLNDLLSKQSQYQEKLYSREGTYNTLADQIRGLTSGGGRANQSAAFNSAMQNLNADRNYGSGDIATKLNFQVSDQQILDDLNTRKIQRLNDVVTNGNAQIAGITERLNTANTLLSSLPEGDPRRASSDAYIKELQADLKSVQEAVASAQDQVSNYINANQANPGQFNPTTIQNPFYQTTNPEIPVQLTQTAASIYNAAQSAQASMYGSQVGAIANSYQSPASAFGAVAQGLGNLFSFKI